MAAALDIGQLRTFVAIDECGGFGRAAESLRLSQSTVSQHVRALEKSLDRRLVERAGRRARLTPDGTRLLAEARGILGAHDAALERLEATPVARLTVGVVDTLVGTRMSPLLAAVRGAFPATSLQVGIDRTERLSAAVRAHTIDLAVVLESEGAIAGADVGRVGLEWWRGPAGEPRGSGVIEVVTTPAPCPLRERTVRALGTRPYAVMAEAAGIDGVVAAVHAGFGVAALPSGARVDGLRPAEDLPQLGTVTVRLLARRGLDPRTETTAIDRIAPVFS